MRGWIWSRKRSDLAKVTLSRNVRYIAAAVQRPHICGCCFSSLGCNHMGQANAGAALYGSPLLPVLVKRVTRRGSRNPITPDVGPPQQPHRVIRTGVSDRTSRPR